MADFLASFNLGAQTAAPSHNSPCDSIDDLQLRLRRTLDEKATSSRAEHVSNILEFRATAQFALTIPEPENGTIEGLNNIDPSLGGVPPTTVCNTQDERQVSRVIGAHEALVDQPRDNPILQRAVAKHIITALSTTDGSAWAIREVTLGDHGWTFTYLCKASYQQWSRAHAKSSTKLTVGDYSLREPDPVLNSRPAFDCRGSVRIIFNRDSRMITIKYDHTALHKTVAELSEIFKPPPRQLGPRVEGQLEQRIQQQKTPRKSRTERRAQDESGNPRKRKKNHDSTVQVAAPTSVMQVSEFQVSVDSVSMGNDTLAAERDQVVNSLAQIQVSDQRDRVTEQNGQPFNDYPQQLVDGGASASTAQTGSSKMSSQPPPGVIFPVNITPAEATRRRDAAISILSEAGVPPDSLSAEQFSIFSNQSPELQKESLNMLIKYGAERLRIVHPSAKEGSTSGQPSTSSTPSLSGQSVSSQPTTSKELVPQSSGYVSAPEARGDEPGVKHLGTSSKPRRKMGKSRNACFPCKSRRVKCPRQRPACSECQAEGQTCVYAPQKPRKKNKKPNPDAAEVEQGEEEEGESDREEEASAGVGGHETNETNHGDSAQNRFQEYSSYPHLPIDDALVSSTDPTNRSTYIQQDDYLQPRPDLPLAHDDGFTVAPHHVLTDPTRLPGRQAGSLTQGSWGIGDSASRTRRSLPSEPTHVESHNLSIENSHPSSNGPSREIHGSQTTATTSGPGNMSHSGTRASQSVDHYKSTEHHELRDGLQHVSALAQAAIQQHQSPTRTAAIMAQARRSPIQGNNTPRTTSYQGQKTQPHDSLAGAYPPPPDTARHSRINSSGDQTSDRTGEASKYGHHATASHQRNQGAGGYDSYSQTRKGTSGGSVTQPPSKTSTAMPMLSQPPLSTASYRTSSNHWSGSQDSNDHAHGSVSAYSTQSVYPQISSTAGPDSRQTYDSRGRTQPATSTRSAFSQQQQTYSSYTPTQNQQSEGTGQQPSWYTFNNSNSNSFTSANNSAGYSWH